MSGCDIIGANSFKNFEKDERANLQMVFTVLVMGIGLIIAGYVFAVINSELQTEITATNDTAAIAATQGVTSKFWTAYKLIAISIIIMVAVFMIGIVYMLARNR